ncbi:T9SS type A sorting domain-containing protein [Bacteroidales bacterium OttesenSCG-928-M11]|nr:T9SS type A sorting domain-containing protein [Bacteroidales bacterium OttesenSCG-928-M11]
MNSTKKIILTLCLCFAVSAAFSQSAYINKVYDFRPAPGQFINEAPEYELGDTKSEIIKKVEEYIVNDQRSLVSLGAYGGYIIFGFDHPVVNVKGEYDFKIQGNAFTPSETAGEMTGGSSEPGIVCVSYDANKNGIPDDDWYELAGSEYFSTQTIQDYEITYYKPENIGDDIRWKDNLNNEGFVFRNTFHTQIYWPKWTNEEVLVFKGKRLADNYSIVENNGNNYYLQKPYDWGYADNLPNNSDESSFKIEWAVDKNGNSIDLLQVDFIKVYTAVNQSCGWLGESSTEIIGAVDLHPDALVSIEEIKDQSFTILSNPIKETLIIYSTQNQTVDLYNIQGKKLYSFSLSEGNNYIELGNLSSGFYILNKQKVVKQ